MEENPVQALIERLRTISAPEQLLLNEPMALHTSFRVGGPADIFYMPDSPEQLSMAFKWAEALNVPALLIGNGSNLIVRDGGLRGLVIALGERYSRIRVEGEELTAQAGSSLKRVALAAQEAGLAGLEFASGIPGTLGGGAAMNAGAYGGQLSDVLACAEILCDGEVRTLSLEEMEMGYRTSFPLRNRCPVLSARFRLTRDDPTAILERMGGLNLRRRARQPLSFPSAGSVFKRPEGHFAGALIEEAGLKGLTIGGAQVSEKHAGFIINLGNATAAEVIRLIDEVRARVKARSGILLEPEVRIVGED